MLPVRCEHCITEHLAAAAQQGLTVTRLGLITLCREITGAGWQDVRRIVDDYIDHHHLILPPGNPEEQKPMLQRMMARYQK